MNYCNSKPGLCRDEAEARFGKSILGKRGYSVYFFPGGTMRYAQKVVSSGNSQIPRGILLIGMLESDFWRVAKSL